MTVCTRCGGGAGPVFVPVCTPCLEQKAHETDPLTAAEQRAARAEVDAPRADMALGVAWYERDHARDRVATLETAALRAAAALAEIAATTEHVNSRRVQRSRKIHQAAVDGEAALRAGLGDAADRGDGEWREGER